MSESEVLSPLSAPGADVVSDEAASASAPTPARKRPKPGERREQILQALAAMLEKPGAERITTAALAAHLGVSEAALYRHFASKARMFEGLIEFIEQSVFTLVQQIVGRDVPEEERPAVDGDAIVFEHERLQARMNQFFDRIESTLRQCLRPAAGALGSSAPTVDAQVAASVLTSFALGRLQRYARSGFRRLPTEHLEASLALMV